jgi:hypothetical protein
MLRSFRCLPAEHAHTNVLFIAKGRNVTCLTQSVRRKVQCVIWFVPRIHDAPIRSMSACEVRRLPADFGFSTLPFTLSWVNQWQTDLPLAASHPYLRRQLLWTQQTIWRTGLSAERIVSVTQFYWQCCTVWCSCVYAKNDFTNRRKFHTATHNFMSLNNWGVKLTPERYFRWRCSLNNKGPKIRTWKKVA